MSREDRPRGRRRNLPAATRLVPVESSMIASIGYDAAERLLEVEFHSGTFYRYLDVPPHVHRELMEAESHGRAFHALVLDVYEYWRVV